MLFMPLFIPLVTAVGPCGLLLGTFVLIPFMRLVFMLVVPAQTLLLMCVKSVRAEVFTLKASTAAATMMSPRGLAILMKHLRTMH